MSKHPENKSTDEGQTLVVVLIDFGQAVEREHPSADELLRRDIQTVRDFFAKQGINTLSVDETEEFVLAPFSIDKETISAPEPIGDAENTWRHNIPGWDDQQVIDDLMAKIQAQTRQINTNTTEPHQT